MALHTDIPTRAQIERLLAARGDSLVSIYVPTSPLTQEAQGDRIAFKNLVSTALEHLRAEDTPKHDVDAIDEGLEDLHDDDDFWARCADHLDHEMVTDLAISCAMWVGMGRVLRTLDIGQSCKVTL